MLEMRSGHFKVPIEGASPSKFLPPHFTRFGRALTDAGPLTTTRRFVHDKGMTQYYWEGQRKMPRTTKVITFSLPPEMDEQLRQVVEEEGRTVSELLREAFRLYLEEREWRRQERMQGRRSRRTEQEETRRRNG